MSHLGQARKVFDIEIAALKAVRAQLDRAFDAAVEILAAALRQRGKIVVVGIGKSGNVGRKIAATLASTGAPASCSTAWTRCTATSASLPTATRFWR